MDDPTLTAAQPATGEPAGLAQAIEHLIADQPPGGPSIQWDVRSPPERLESLLEGWGVGFDPATGEPRCLGWGIRERAWLLGGRARVDSAPGKGTRVLVHLPRDGSRKNSIINDRSRE